MTKVAKGYASRAFPNPAWAWPRGGRTQLLEAALLPDTQKALSVLGIWLEENNLDDITFADHRLLAVIADRHGRNIGDLAEFPRLKGLQRQLWTQSRMRVHTVLPVLQLLVASGIEIMLLKGAARIALRPDAQRQRAHQDVDILVRTDQIGEAARILTQQGWETARGDTALAAITRAPATRAINFQKLPWGDIDLHRSAYHGGNYHHVQDDALWQRASRAEYFGLPVLVPEAAERLAMTLSHGAWSPETHSDWLVDAADILTNDQIDWAYFKETVKKRKIGGQIQIGLSYLHHNIGLSLPPDAQSLLSEKSAFSTLLVARAKTDLPSWLRPIREICFNISRARRDRSHSTNVPKLKLSIARLTSSERSNGHATIATITSQQVLTKGDYNFRAELVIQAPICKRRIEFELNSASENLARFRIYSAQHNSGNIRARVSARIRINIPAEELQLIIRPSALLSPGCSDEDIAKYAILPFQMVKYTLARL